MCEYFQSTTEPMLFHEADRMAFELVYIPGNYPSEYFVKLLLSPVRARRDDDLRNQIPPQLNFCDRTNNEIFLTGLDLARGALGIHRYNGNRMEPRSYRRDTQHIDKLFLVDVRNGVVPKLKKSLLDRQL